MPKGLCIQCHSDGHSHKESCSCLCSAYKLTCRSAMVLYFLDGRCAPVMHVHSDMLQYPSCDARGALAGWSLRTSGTMRWRTLRTMPAVRCCTWRSCLEHCGGTGEALTGCQALLHSLFRSSQRMLRCSSCSDAESCGFGCASRSASACHVVQQLVSTSQEDRLFLACLHLALFADATLRTCLGCLGCDGWSKALTLLEHSQLCT